MKFVNSSKGALISALFLFSSCAKSGSEWEYESMQSCDPPIIQAKLYLEPENIFHETGIEITYNSLLGTKMYLNLHGCPVKTSLEHKNLAKVSILIAGEEEESSAFIFQGNQRLLLSDELKSKIIAGLLNNHPVEIKVGNYYSKISPKGFEKKYRRLRKAEI